jgi:hypothetical protein
MVVGVEIVGHKKEAKGIAALLKSMSYEGTLIKKEFLTFEALVLHSYVRNFLSNPRRKHSGQKDKEKEEYGLL